MPLLQLETVLLASVKKESNALAKATLLDCLAHAVLLAESPSEDVLSVVRGSLQPTNAALLPTLYCLYAILKVSTTVSEVDTLKKSLEEAVKRAIAKPFLCGREGILALPSLIRLSILANQELSPMVAESFKEGSFLFQASLYNSANKDDERLIAWCHAALHCTVELVLSTCILSDAEQTAFLGFFFSQIMTENPVARESAFALLDRLGDLALPSDGSARRLPAVPHHNGPPSTSTTTSTRCRTSLFSRCCSRLLMVRCSGRSWAASPGARATPSSALDTTTTRLGTPSMDRCAARSRSSWCPTR